MQFQCFTSELIAALQTVTKALGGRTSNQILEGVLIEAQGDTLTLTCSDERITIVTHTHATIDESGRGVVPGKLFNEIVRRLPEAKTSVRMDERFVFTIKSGALHMNISGQDAELFPALPKVERAREFALPQDMLRDMMQKTSFAISQDDAREVLTGCFLEIDRGDINMVALDGYRLAKRHAKCSESLDKLGAIIPGRAVDEIGKLLSDSADAFAQLSFGSNKLHIRLGDTEIYVILIDGEYIQYRQILPRSFTTQLELALEPFSRCLDRASLIAREGTNNLVILHIAGNELTVEAHSQTGDMSEVLETDQQGADLTIAFNVRYLTDVVNRIAAERIEMKFNSNVSPCVITPAGSDDYLHLILPVRTGAR